MSRRRYTEEYKVGQERGHLARSIFVFVLGYCYVQAAPALILFGLVDTAGAAWTAMEIRASHR